MKVVVLLFLVMLVSCTSAPIGTNETADEFVLTAVSWEGAHIREMIAVWGRPNDAHQESATFSNGYARWKQDTMVSGCIDKYPVRQTRVCYDPQGKVCQIIDRNQGPRQICERDYKTSRNNQMHRCIVTATYDATGIITRIEAFSRRCSKVYAETLPHLAR